MRPLLILVLLASLALALPAVPGIQTLDFKVDARDDGWYRAVQYTDKDSPRGNNITYVQALITVSRDKASDISIPLTFVWVYNWYDHDWAKLSTNENECIVYPKANPLDVGGSTFQLGSKTLLPGEENVTLDLVFWTTEKSGPYYLTIYNCDVDIALRVKGHTYFRNPYGWLNGEDWPSAALNGLFMTLYILFSLIFILFLWRNREFAHPFMWLIAALLIVAWVFTGLSFIIYMNINSRGRISTGVLVIVSIVAASRETFARLLLLFISLGYQVIFPVMGGICFKATIGIYAGIYWLFYFVVFLLNCLFVNTNVGINGGGYTFASVIQVIVELIWWFWIFYNVVVISRLLAVGGQAYHEKYRIYRNLMIVMLLIGIWVVISYVVFLIGAAQDKLDGWWRNWWFFDFYGEIAFLVVIIVLMSSWRPGRDPVKYQYQPLVLGHSEAPNPPIQSPNAPSSPTPLPNRDASPYSTI